MRVNPLVIFRGIERPFAEVETGDILRETIKNPTSPDYSIRKGEAGTPAPKQTMNSVSNAQCVNGDVLPRNF
jgi:hypothetical protein